MHENIRINNRSTRTATIDIEGVIGMAENLQFSQPEARVATYDKLREILTEIRGLNTPRVVVNIRSAGGDVNDALLILDALMGLDARITTRCYGYVASAATIIAQAASPGRREISSNALYLIHNSTSQTEGNAVALAQAMQLLHKTDESIAGVYAARSGRPAERFAALMGENEGNGRWLSPQETVALGLADKITGASRISDSAAGHLSVLNLPAIPEAGHTSLTQKIVDKVKEFFKPAPVASSMAENAPVQDNGMELFSDLRSLEAKLNAKPTETEKKEDPETDEIIASPNRSAYEEDAMNFR